MNMTVPFVATVICQVHLVVELYYDASSSIYLVCITKIATNPGVATDDVARDVTAMVTIHDALLL